jgi:hypothetical protein
MDRDPGANEALRRQRIEMFYLSAGDGLYPIVREGSRPALVRIFNALGRQFRRETRFDLAPYIAGKREREEGYEQAGVLIPGDDLIAGARLIAGVIGLDRGRAPAERWQIAPEQWRLGWVYLHPYARGEGRIERAWTAAVRRSFGPVAIVDDRDDTPAGRALLKRLRGS